MKRMLAALALMGALSFAALAGPLSALADGPISGNLLENADFESGPVVWTESSSGGWSIITSDGMTGYDGDWQAYLGDYENGVDAVFQDVDIPASAADVSLRFWYDISTKKAAPTPLDTMAVQVVDPLDGSVLQTLATLSNLDMTATWTQSTAFDLSAYKGRKVRLKFLATTDASTELTGFYLDKVTVTVTLAAGDATAPTGAISINGGAGVTADTSVTLTLAANDDTGISRLEISNDDLTWISRDWSGTSLWELTPENGQKTVSVRFQDFAGRWSSVASASIIYQVPTDQVQDGGFDSSNGWYGTSSGGYPLLEADPLGGYYASLGNFNDERGVIFQEVTIPAAAARADLRFWYNITTEENPNDAAYDELYISVNDPVDGHSISTVGTLSNLDATDGWKQSSSYDLSAFAGQTVRVVFYAFNDETLPTSFKLDDVELVTEEIVFPTATIAGVPAAPTSADTATLTVGGLGVVAYKYSLDGGTWTELPVETPITLSGLAEGTHTVAVLGKSRLGGWQTTTTTASWLVDVTPPTAVIAAPPAGLTIEHNLALTVGGAGVEAYRYRLDNGEYGSEAPVGAALMLTGLAAGTHNLSVIGRDAAGNWQGSPTTATWLVTRLYMPQTGQTTCYDSSGSLAACAGTGQDGDTLKGVPWPAPRFRDNGDGTVTDDLTGLVWSQNANVMAGRDAAFDTDAVTGDGRVFWQRALDYVKKLNAESYLGHSDWRLPNIVELESLVNVGQSFNDTWLNSSGFLNVQAGTYWSATSSATSPSWAYMVAMGSGDVYDGRKTSDYESHVWPVRGVSGPLAVTPVSLPRTGQETCYSAEGGEIPCAGTGQDGEHRSGTAFPAARFADHGNGTMTDATGLTWTKNILAPGPEACGPGTDKTWLQALDYIACLNASSYLGHNDWRLPNRNELASLTDIASLRASGFGLPEYGSFAYWTSSSNRSWSSEAWLVGLDRYAGRQAKESLHHVWPVRGGEILVLPAVVSTLPGNGSTGVPVTAAISAVFNKDIDQATLSTATFNLGSGVNGAVSYDPATRTAIFAPAAPLLYATTYTATITTGVKDLGGTPLVVARSWSFTTEPQPISLGEALDTAAVIWSAGGDGPWKGVADFSSFGGDSARSGAITDSQDGWIDTTVTGPAELSFYWKVSSESDYDFLTFSIDGASQAAISGEVAWEQRTFSIPPGTHSLRWTYSKDFIMSGGDDAGWLDRVVIAAAQPPTQTLTLGFSGTGTGSVNSDPAGLVACTGGCTASVAQGAQVKLMATPDANSIFDGWTGAGCSGTGICTVTMDADKSITAQFAAAPLVKVGATAYATLQSAFSAAPAGSTVRARANEFAEIVILSRQVDLTLDGGYNADFTSNGGFSIIHGTLTLQGGPFTVRQLILR